MPCDLDAKYIEWKIVFESVMEKLSVRDNITLIGHSLGGNFLLKYFGEIEKYDGNMQADSQEQINLLFIQNIHLIAACISE